MDTNDVSDLVAGFPVIFNQFSTNTALSTHLHIPSYTHTLSHTHTLIHSHTCKKSCLCKHPHCHTFIPSYHILPFPMHPYLHVVRGREVEVLVALVGVFRVHPGHTEQYLQLLGQPYPSPTVGSNVDTRQALLATQCRGLL